MRLAGIELNLLEMLEDETLENKNFNPDEWSLEDIAILRRVANFIEREQNERRENKSSSGNIQQKTH